MQKNKNFEQIPSNVISKNKCCPGLPYIFIPENTIWTIVYSWICNNADIQNKSGTIIYCYCDDLHKALTYFTIAQDGAIEDAEHQ